MSYTRRLEESAVNLAAEAADLLVQFNYLKAERDEKAKEIERLRAENEHLRIALRDEQVANWEAHQALKDYIEGGK